MAANINGSLRVAGQVLNLKPENLAADPTGGGLVESRLWYNTVSKAFKFYNGTGVVDLAAGGISQEDLETALLPYAETTEVNSAISTAIADLVSGTEMQSAIDNALAGLDFQADVLGLETDYVATPGRYIYVDGSLFTSGVAAAAGDIVTVDAAGVILSVAYDVSAAGPGALTWNVDGTQWLRWDGATWAEFGGLTGFTAGNGIEKTGDVVSVKAANASIVVAAGGISVGDLSATYVTPAAQTTALADYDLSTEVDTKISTAVSGLATAASVTAVSDRLVGSWYTITTNAANTTHTVTHNIGFRYPVVQVVDKATNKPVIPDDIEFTTANEFVITLATAIDVIVSVIGLKPAA